MRVFAISDLHLSFGANKPMEVFGGQWTNYLDKIVESWNKNINEDDVVLIHDDLLATGGTMLAAYHLVQKLNPKKVYVNFIIELEGLKGREIFPADAEIDCLLTLEGK